MRKKVTKRSESLKEGNNNLKSIRNKHTPLWKKNTYELGTWTKEGMTRNNKLKYLQRLQISNQGSFNNSTTRKRTDYSPLCNSVVDTTPKKKLNYPNNIFLSIQSSLSSITQDIN